MASHNVGLNQAGEFFGRFYRLGGTDAMLKKLLGDDAVMQQWMQAGSALPAFRLIHGVFNLTDDILESFKERCIAKGIDFTKFSWVGSEQAPSFTDDDDLAVVLDATFDTLQNTFEFAWSWTVDGQEDKSRWDGMLSDQKKLRLLSDNRPDKAEGDGADFKPWTLTWHRIKLNANIGKKPNGIRDPKASPGCSALFAAAEHPQRIKAIDYKTRYGFWLPGLKCTTSGYDAWQHVPYVFLDVDDRQVELGAYWYGYSYDDLAVPVLWE